jgi:carbon monoxide dehydrogenase subunit G
MDMAGERLIEAPRERVWLGLNDPAILKAAIPGCESLEQTAPDSFKATAAVKLGPIAARFNGRVTLADIVPEASYTISGEGQGGVAGFAKGGAKVSLADAEGGATLLTYTVNAQVGGKLAQLGARLIDASAKQMADQFFTRFAALLAPPPPEAAPDADDDMGSPDLATPAAPSHARPATVSLTALLSQRVAGLPFAYWLTIGLFALICALVLGAYL